MNEFNNKLNNNEEMQKNIDSNLQSQNENQNPYINNPFLYSETIKQESDKFNEHTANKVEEQPSHYVPEKNIEQPSHYIPEQTAKQPSHYVPEQAVEQPSSAYSYSNMFNPYSYSGQTANTPYYTTADKNEKQPYTNCPNIVINSAKKQKKGSKSTKAAAIVMSIILGGISIGTGLGIGYNVSKPITNSSESGSFSFGDDVIEQSDIETNAQEMFLSSSNSVIDIIKQIKDTVVNITVTTRSTNFFNQVFESSGSGSGIIYSQDDTKVYIVTNNHVIDGASTVTISITGEEQVSANLVGKDAQSDLAVISVLKTDLASAGINSVNTAVFSDSDQVDVGEYVLAIGNALGQGKTVTQGIISAQNKEINIDGKKFTVLQTDAAINPGNSGGALVNSEGKVLGINTAKLASSDIEGTGYAIPASIVKDIVPQLIKNGTVARPYLGIVGATISDNFRNMYNLDVFGVFVRGVDKGSSAEKAGIIASDIITSFNAEPIESLEDLSEMISECKVGDIITLGILRNGSIPMKISVTLTDLNETQY